MLTAIKNKLYLKISPSYSIAIISHFLPALNIFNSYIVSRFEQTLEGIKVGLVKSKILLHYSTKLSDCEFKSNFVFQVLNLHSSRQLERTQLCICFARSARCGCQPPKTRNCQIHLARRQVKNRLNISWSKKMIEVLNSRAV